MFVQIILSLKTFLTLTTWIQLSCSMYLFVFFQMCFSCKPFVTHCTQIRSWLVIMWMLSDIITISFNLHLIRTFTCATCKYKTLTVTIELTINKVYKNTSDCDQSNVYSLCITFLTISPICHFILSLYIVVSYAPFRKSVQSSVICVKSHYRVRSVCTYINWIRLHVLEICPFEFLFSKWPLAAILDLIQPEMVPFDPP